MARWCTVTANDSSGRRFSFDILAESAYDAAHLYLAEAKNREAEMLPVPNRATMIEVAVDGKLLRIRGDSLRRWIAKRRSEINGPRGVMFRKRPQLESRMPGLTYEEMDGLKSCPRCCSRRFWFDGGVWQCWRCIPPPSDEMIRVELNQPVN